MVNLSLEAWACHEWPLGHVYSIGPQILTLVPGFRPFGGEIGLSRAMPNLIPIVFV